MKNVRAGVFLLIACFLALQIFEASCSADQIGIGIAHYGVAYDGANIWVANYSRNTVTKLRASDGSLVATYRVAGPWGMAFDGEDMWVANYSGGTVTELRASDGAVIGVYQAGVNPKAVLFDGSNIWIASGGDKGSVTKLRAADGSLVWTTPVDDPWGMAFDGSTVWVTNNDANRVTRLNSNGCVVGVYRVGDHPMGIAFDGRYMWVANNGGTTVMKLSAIDGSRVGKFRVGINPFGIFSEGNYVWVTRTNGVLTELTTGGCMVRSYDVSDYPDGIAFDGTNIWVANTEGEVKAFRAYTGALVATCDIQQSCAHGPQIAESIAWNCSPKESARQCRRSKN